MVRPTQEPLLFAEKPLTFGVYGDRIWYKVRGYVAEVWIIPIDLRLFTTSGPVVGASVDLATDRARREDECENDNEGQRR
jgi:hypothetical protein